MVLRIATSDILTLSECSKFVFGRGSPPWLSLQRSQTLKLVLGALLLRGWELEREERGEEGRGREREGLPSQIL